MIKPVIYTNKCITKFDKKYYFLSNFYPIEVEYDGITYRSSEAAFQAMKCVDKKDRYAFKDLSSSKAKQLGRRVKLRPDWENIKDQIMYEVVKSKFSNSMYLKSMILGTGDAYLEEGNTWGDKYWGTVNGVGNNKLGEILMRVRDELSNE